MHTPSTTPASATYSSTGSSRDSGLIFLVAAGLLWGTGGLLGTLLAETTGLGPAAVAVYRIGIGGLLLIAALAVSRRPLPRGRAVLRRLIAVGCLAATFQACYFTAVSLTSVSLATLVTIGSAPAMVLVGEQLTGRRRVDLHSVGVLVLAIVGLTLLVGFPASGSQPAHVVAGLLFALASAASFAVFTLVCAIPVPGLDGMATTAYGFTLGAVLLMPVALFTGGLAFDVDLTSVTLLLALGGVPTALAYVCFFRGLVRVRATTAALTALLEPLTGAVLGAVFLGDRLGLIGWLGAVVLSAAVVLGALAERSGQREEGAPVPSRYPRGSEVP